MDDLATVARIMCPAPRCGADNEAGAPVCVGCLTPLAGYGRLSMHPNALFNRGLRAAREGDAGAARDLFAAVVFWLPYDLEARNAYALACLDGGDLSAAQIGWEEVLARSADDGVATRGLHALARASAARVPRPQDDPAPEAGVAAEKRDRHRRRWRLARRLRRRPPRSR